MKAHAMFLRAECVPPDGIGLTQEQFGGRWMSLKDTMAAALDVKVRDAGWHFIWLVDAYARFGVGRTATSAIDKAIIRALNQVKERFNAAKLESVKVSEYPGFQVAKITLSVRHIQQRAFPQPD
jgi:hypothetical protein